MPSRVVLLSGLVTLEELDGGLKDRKGRRGRRSSDFSIFNHSTEIKTLIDLEKSNSKNAGQKSSKC